MQMQRQQGAVSITWPEPNFSGGAVVFDPGFTHIRVDHHTSQADYIMSNPQIAADKIASLWNLRIRECVGETVRARIYKVDGPQGLSALKIYKHIGFSGEGAAIPFLRNLHPDFGVRIYRTSTWRAAVLMEWLEGPTLAELVEKGERDLAIRNLSQAGANVQNTTFKLPFRYPKRGPKYRAVLTKAIKTLPPAQTPDALHRTRALLDYLILSTPEQKVIHGDLLFGNVILTEQGPKLIDPKGARNDPASEFAKALTPRDKTNVSGNLGNRLQSEATVMAEAIDVAPGRLIQWVAVSIALDTFRIHEKKAAFDAKRLPLLHTVLDLIDRTT